MIPILNWGKYSHKYFKDTDPIFGGKHETDNCHKKDQVQNMAIRSTDNSIVTNILK